MFSNQILTNSLQFFSIDTYSLSSLLSFVHGHALNHCFVILHISTIQVIFRHHTTEYNQKILFALCAITIISGGDNEVNACKKKSFANNLP